MKLNKLLVLALSIGLFFTSCSNDDDAPPAPRGDYENGILISHEGNFTNGVGTVSYISNDYNVVEHNIFENVNGRTLGTVAQSMTFNGDLAYIISNVSDRIDVVNRYTFESVATIDMGLNNPRYMAISNGKGYITNWGEGNIATDDYIAILDLDTNTIQNSIIPVEEGPEEILTISNSVYVSHKGGFGQNNKISVINTSSDAIAEIITVGDVPNSLQLDNSGNLWVLCGGKPSWTGTETGGQIFKINTNDNTATSMSFADNEHPDFLTFEDGVLYYYAGGSVYKMNTNDTELPTVAEITGLNLNEMNVKDGVLYGLDAKDFQSDGDLIIYDLSTNTETNKFTLGIIPGEVYFN